MRTFLYAFALCSLLVLTSGCAMAGANGTQDGTSNWTNGYVIQNGGGGLVGVIVGGVTWWNMLRVQGSGACVDMTRTVAVLNPSPGHAYGLNGLFQANIRAYTDGNTYIISIDTSGDGFVSPLVPGIAGGLGWISGSPCEAAFFADVARAVLALPAGFSKASTEVMVGGTVIVKINLPAALIGGRSALDKLSIEERVQLLNSIDTTQDMVELNGETFIDVSLTEVTVNGDTFRPEGVGLLVHDSFTRATYNMDSPGIQPFYGWLADQLQAGIDSGVEPSITATVNDNVSFTGNDVYAFMADHGAVWTGLNQDFVDNLRNIAGSDITGTETIGRTGRR